MTVDQRWCPSFSDNMSSEESASVIHMHTVASHLVCKPQWLS